MTRYFYVHGTSHIPARFYTVAEITTWTTLLHVKRALSGTTGMKISGIHVKDGYIRKIENKEVDKDYLLTLHKFKTVTE